MSGLVFHKTNRWPLSIVAIQVSATYGECQVILTLKASISCLNCNTRESFHSSDPAKRQIKPYKRY